MSKEEKEETGTMEIKVMVVPGRVVTVKVLQKSTVFEVCTAAGKEIPAVDWAGLAESREVRVQGLKFSNSEGGEWNKEDGEHGSIYTTPLEDGNVVLIITKIEGNGPETKFVLTCTINGQDYALATPIPIGEVLEDVAEIDLSKVAKVLVNGVKTDPNRLVADGDVITTVAFGEKKSRK